MNKNLKISALVFSFAFLFCLAFSVQAGSDDNTSGWAWSENIGWVSFNNTTGGGSDYGVNIDTSTGKLSGYTWSEHIGWITFNESDLTGCPSGACQAHYDSNTGALTGWGRVLANGGGWDGWIRFENASIDSNGDWHGWAWSSEVVGWLSFNSAEGGGSSYKVTSNLNNPPTKPTGLQAINPSNYCGKSPNNIFLSWQFNDPDSGDTQSAYEIEVTRKSDGTTETTGQQSSSASSFPVLIINNHIGSQLIWYDSSSQGYSWRVRTWDSSGAQSPWSDFNSFNTTKHQWPSIIFNSSPEEPSKGEEVHFTDSSNCYDGDGGCDIWSWVFEDGDPSISPDQNPTVQFIDNGTKTVTLEVTDSDGYSCPLTKCVNVSWALPDWREIFPW